MGEAAEVNDSLATTLSNVRKFHAEGKYSDVKLQIGPEVFSCQRSLLAAVSEYFDVMFSSSGFEESNIPGDDQPITLNEIDATAFNEILGFIYTGEVCVNDSNVYPLLFLNDFLQLRTAHIKQNCLKYLKSCSDEKIGHISNAFYLFCFAKKKEENAIVDILSDHICRHLCHYSMDAQLVEIDFESLNALLKFGKNYILPLPGSHNVILKIIHTWVNHNRGERKKYRRELMENIDFSNISSEYALLIIDKLEDVADKVAKFTKDTTGSVAFSEMETLRTGVEIDLTDEDTRHTATIEFKVENFSVLKMDKILYSSPKRISNLLWRIGVQRDDSNSNSYLKVSLVCSSKATKSTEWNCCANSTITIMAFKEPTESYSQELVCVNFTPELDGNWRLPEFIKWSDLIDPKNGYIRNNSMVLRADVRTEVPVRRVPEAKA